MASDVSTATLTAGGRVPHTKSRRKPKPWKCTRHTFDDDDDLSGGQRATELVLPPPLKDGDPTGPARQLRAPPPTQPWGAASRATVPLRTGWQWRFVLRARPLQAATTSHRQAPLCLAPGSRTKARDSGAETLIPSPTCTRAGAGDPTCDPPPTGQRSSH